jgi:peptide/nickel transport system permease protein
MDRLSVVVVLMSNSMPPFWLGLLLIWLFVAYLGILPSGGMYSAREGASVTGILRHLVLPAVTLAAPNLAYVTRMTRSCVLEVLHMDYVRTARAKGLSEAIVILKHAVRNALIPLSTLIGLRFGYLLAGSVVTETIFSWPGIGLLMYRAITERDIPVIQGGVLLIALNFALINLLVDMSYAVLNPQIAFE